MVKEIILYSQDIPSGMTLRNLWNDDSISILLNEYKKLKETYSIRRSSNMLKKGWEIIKNKLHAAGYTDIRTQHVIKKFSALKLYYKEFREGLPVKQKIYNFIGILSELLDDDPYIEYARPTKRMKEKKRTDRKQLPYNESYITLEFANENGEQVTEIISTYDNQQIDQSEYIDASFLLRDNSDEIQQEVETTKVVKKKSVKLKKELKNDDDKPEMPSWISYLVDLLKREEQQRSAQLWTLHDNICQADKVKLDILDRLVHSLRRPNGTVSKKGVGAAPQIVPKSRLVIPESKSDNPRNIIIVDEEGSIYLKPSDLLKRKAEQSEYILPHKIIKSETQVEFLGEGEMIETPQLQLQLIGEGDEIIIENCDESEIYKVVPAYEGELDESNVISHVEIVEEQSEHVIEQHDIDNIEFIDSVSHQHQR